MTVKLKRNHIAWQTGGSAAGEWVTECGRFYVQNYGKKGWTAYSDTPAAFQLLRNEGLDGRYFPTRKELLEALQPLVERLDGR